jgi:hypothetical protein
VFEVSLWRVIPLPGLGAGERTRFQDPRAAVGTNGCAHERRQVDAIEVERSERLGEDGDPLARPKLGVNEDERLTAEPA